MTLQDTYSYLVKYIKQNYGKRCKDFELNCMVCQKYLALDIIKNILDDAREDSEEVR